jgi:hypothetical protein
MTRWNYSPEQVIAHRKKYALASVMVEPGGRRPARGAGVDVESFGFVIWRDATRRETVAGKPPSPVTTSSREVRADLDAPRLLRQRRC